VAQWHKWIHRLVVGIHPHANSVSSKIAFRYPLQFGVEMSFWRRLFGFGMGLIRFSGRFH